MDRLTKKLSVGATVAIATAGLVLGAMVARAVVQKAPREVAQETSSVVVTTHSAQAEPVLNPRGPQGEESVAQRLGKEEEARAPTGALPKHELSSELSASIRSDKWLMATRFELHQSIGEGVLYKDGRATVAGQFIVDSLSSIESHGLDAEAFASEELNTLLTNATDADHEIEAALGKSLTRLVLEMRMVRRAGPFKITRKIEDLLDKKKTRRRFFEIATKVAASLSEESAEQALWPQHPLYLAMLKARVHYTELASKGGCKKVVESWRIRPDANGSAVAKVAERLRCEGYYSGPTTVDYSEELLTAVKLFQRNHDLKDDGFVFEGTLRSMNVPMKRRLEQISLALQRIRESHVQELGDFYVYINLPAFSVRVFKDGKLLKTHRAIVGTNRLDDDKNKLRQGHLNRTKLFTTRLYEIVVNPDWILPVRIEKGELAQQVLDDPGYLEKNNIRKVTLPNGREVYVQRRGRTNALGRVKFLLRRSQAIFLHDTDKKHKFRHQRRDFSHGCIRVDMAVDFANFLLLNDGWERNDVYRTLHKQRSQRGMKLKQPVPLITEYITVDISAEGLPVFLSDIYGYDKAYADGDLPPREYILWGQPRLRPRWVPRVPKEIVKRWRAEGKPAPRNYDPAKHGGG